MIKKVTIIKYSKKLFFYQAGSFLKIQILKMVTISVIKGIKQHTPKITQTKSLHDR